MLNETVKHYDLEVDFFQQFLDPYMKYTSGLFEKPGEDLAVATRRMLDTIIDMGGITNGARVLEVGPGWGALLKRLLERGINAHYCGVSPSRVQNDYIKNFKPDSARLVTSTFESLNYDGPLLDVIVLIGSYCHLSQKSEQLARMRKMLTPNGCILIEDTFFISNAEYIKHAEKPATRFVQEGVFGFAEILSLEEQLKQAQQVGLKVSAMLEHSSSYKATINCWIKKLRQLDPKRFPKSREFIKYMNIAQRGWNNTTHNQLLVLQRS